MIKKKRMYYVVASNYLASERGERERRERERRAAGCSCNYGNAGCGDCSTQSGRLVEAKRKKGKRTKTRREILSRGFHPSIIP
jgi:hypothetical protein